MRLIRCCNRKPAYLNVPFFIARTVCYFAVWIILGRLLVTWSLQQDRTADATLTLRLQRLSGPGLVLYGLTVSFAAIDWMMSLEPKWYSTIFGMMFMVSFGLAALAMAILATRFLETRKAPRPRGIAGPLARSRQSLACFRDVLGVPEFFSVSSDLVGKSGRRDPMVFASHRRRMGVAGHALILFQFALPFVLLLSRNTKRDSGTLAAVAGAILFMHWLDILWMVVPSFYPARFHIHWLDIVAPVAIGGLWLAAFIGYLKARSLLPLHDPRFAEALEQAQEA